MSLVSRHYFPICLSLDPTFERDDCACEIIDASLDRATLQSEPKIKFISCSLIVVCSVCFRHLQNNYQNINSTTQNVVIAKSLMTSMEGN